MLEMHVDQGAVVEGVGVSVWFEGW